MNIEQMTLSMWNMKNQTLLTKMNEYKIRYHANVCARAGEGHKKNGCYIVGGVRYCRSARKAVAMKFKKEIDRQILFLLTAKGMATTGNSARTPVPCQGMYALKHS